MNKSHKTLFLEVSTFLFLLIVIVVTVLPLAGKLSTPTLITLICGPFAAGASLTNIVRNHTMRRRKEQNTVPEQ